MSSAFACCRCPKLKDDFFTHVGKIAASTDNVLDGVEYTGKAGSNFITMIQYQPVFSGQQPTTYGASLKNSVEELREMNKLLRLPLVLAMLVSGKTTAAKPDGSRDWAGIAIGILVVVARIFNFMKYFVKEITMLIGCAWTAIISLCFYASLRDAHNNRDEEKAPVLARQAVASGADFLYMYFENFTVKNPIAFYVGTTLGAFAGVVNVAVKIIDAKA